MGRPGKGVTVSGGKVRIAFNFQGQRCKETLPMSWTAANKLAGENTVKAINKKIADGTFDYAHEFPQSLRVRRGQIQGDVGATLAKVLEAWLATKAKLAPNTLKCYRNAAGVWLVIFGPETPMPKMSSVHVETTIAGWPFASAKLQNDYLIVLRGALALYAKSDRGWVNPMPGVANAKSQTAPPDPLSRREMRQVLGYMKKNFDQRVYAWFVFQFETGMRPEESIALCWDDVDWKRKTAYVSKARTLSIAGPVKTYAARDVDLSPAAIGALKDLSAHPQIKALPGVPVFQNPNICAPFNDNRCQHELWKVALIACKVKARRSYNTRHTFATLRLMVGAVPAYISRQMGHKSAMMLFEKYAKWIDADKSERDRVQALLAAQAMADAVESSWT